MVKIEVDNFFSQWKKVSAFFNLYLRRKKYEPNTSKDDLIALDSIENYRYWEFVKHSNAWHESWKAFIRGQWMDQMSDYVFYKHEGREQ